MYDFAYHRARSVEDALSVLAGAEDGTLMAGGMTLLPTVKQRLAQPSDIVDLGGIAELSSIREEGGAIVIGATTTHATVAADATVRARIPALAALAESIGDPAVRNRGTIGGSIANNDPAADYPAGLVGLGATVRTNRREIAADDFFTGMFETALGDGEMVTAVSVPVPAKAGYAKFPNPASRYAVVGVMVSQGPAGTRVAVTGAGPCVFRVPAMESALGGNFSADAIAGVAVAADDLNADMHASADYRAHLVGVMAGRAVAAAG
ncbi:MAG: FAD binding domain-containing protein [Kiloniellaceae bacterium]